jgi:hypothetical protein
LPSQLRRLRARVGNGTELGFREGLEVLIVLLPHVTGANQGNAQWRIQSEILL